MDYLICCMNFDVGFCIDWWPGQSNRIRGISCGKIDTEQNNQDEIARSYTMMACSEADLRITVEKMSMFHVGKDIKVFKLTEVHTRIPGELKSKTVTKDGILPE